LAVVADAADGLANDARDVDVRGRGDLARDDGEAGGDHGLARDAAERVAVEQRVEDGIGDLIGHLVGMALRYRFRGEQPALHGASYPSLPGVWRTAADRTRSAASSTALATCRLSESGISTSNPFR